VATGRGDDGTTGLLFGGERISKDDPRTEAFGAIDEAIAALGLARAELAVKAEHGTLPRAIARLPEVLLRVQRDLFVAGAELATAPDAANRQRPGETRVTVQMVSGLDELLDETEAHVALPREFVVPGETRLSASLELARTIVRRAERRAVAVRKAEPLPEDQLVPYLNRLADLLWILARAAEQGESRAATPSKTHQDR
jgi:cob(I)alamin adenosyltransferase